MSGSGIITSPQKSVGDLLTSGAQQGATSAAEKVADYYLRQAEAMSPVLTVPSGVRVNAQITQGFFVGEVSTHKRLNLYRLKTVGSVTRMMFNVVHNHFICNIA